MNTGQQGRTPTYDNEFKIALAREYLTTTQGYGAIAAKYKLSGPGTVRHFVSWYKKNYDSSLISPTANESGVVNKTDERELEKQLQQANLTIAGLQILIETAQRELRIDIVKKPGTKQ